METPERELTWEEFIDLDFAYAMPRASSREQSEELWNMVRELEPGAWKYVLVGPDKPTAEKNFLNSRQDIANHTITVGFE